MKVIVGLGNPGLKYAPTRHNVGFWTIDKLAEQQGIAVTKSKFQSLVGEYRQNGEAVLLVKPQTFMNLSGLAVQEIAAYYKLQPETDILVIYDDMDFRPGQLKLRTQGSAGGHNGIKSIISSVGTDVFCRARVGVGRPVPGQSVIDYVLGTFAPDDRMRVMKAVEAAAQAVVYSLDHTFERAMSQYNQVSFE